MTRKTRHYDDEFKREAINLVKSSTKCVADIARDLGLAPSTLHTWLTKSGEDQDGKIVVLS